MCRCAEAHQKGLRFYGESASFPACRRNLLVNPRPSERPGRQGPLGSCLVRHDRKALRDGADASSGSSAGGGSRRGTKVTFVRSYYLADTRWRMRPPWTASIRHCGWHERARFPRAQRNHSFLSFASQHVWHDGGADRTAIIAAPRRVLVHRLSADEHNLAAGSGFKDLFMRAGRLGEW